MKWKKFTLRQFLERIKFFIIKSTRVKHLQKEIYKFSSKITEISCKKGIVTSFASNIK